ncbi:glutamate formimidoyltransferase [bacterium]|nr:glutamate formimidoyltransferase [bacterium]
MKLIECVPNFSEGKDQKKIQTIVDAITSVQGMVVLDVDMGADANRTVVTAAGPSGSVVEAGLCCIYEASRQIDMRIHTGMHPRMGATDVFPLIPLHEMTLEECSTLSRQLGERVGRELKIPVYLYEASAENKNRRKLSEIRSGGYESFSIKMRHPDWKPDFGPDSLHDKAGVTAIGARSLLIAFNINLNTQDVRTAKHIAAEIRESGRDVKRDGRKRRVPGLLKACQAIGWNMPGYGLTQVSTNLTDYKMTPPHKVYETCQSLAMKYGTTVIGSELVGLIPKQALIMAGHYYAERHSGRISTEESLIDLAVEAMGLDSIHPFDPKEKILEYRIKDLMNICLNL